MAEMAELGRTPPSSIYGGRAEAQSHENLVFSARLDMIPISLDVLSFDILTLLLFRNAPLTSKAVERQLQCAYITDFFVASYAMLINASDNQQHKIINEIANKVTNANDVRGALNAFCVGYVKGLAAYLTTDDKKIGIKGRADIKRIRLVAAINELTQLKIPSSTKIDTALSQLKSEYHLIKTTRGWQANPELLLVWLERRKEMLREADMRMERIVEQAKNHVLDKSSDDYLTPEEKKGIKITTTHAELDALVIKKLTDYYTPVIMDFYLLFVKERTEFSSALVRNAKYLRYFA